MRATRDAASPLCHLSQQPSFLCQLFAPVLPNSRGPLMIIRRARLILFLEFSMVWVSAALHGKTRYAE